MSAPRAYRLNVAPTAIDDLHARLALTRWPDEVDDAQWSYGVSREYLQTLVRYWLREFDWRAAEREINGFDQFLLNLDGLDLHFIHQRSTHADATPLLITHGWPGSIVEFLDVIPRLTQPEKFGGDPRNAFHVVAPSVQGFGPSPPAVRPGMSYAQIADRHRRLMTALGYERYIAQGGDLGAPITHLLGRQDPEHCRALHFTVASPTPPAGATNPMSLLREHEKEWVSTNERNFRHGMGYYHIQIGRPQTLGYALADSPAGWCAWVSDRFHQWTDCAGEIRNAVSWDRLLTNISLFWFTGTIASSLRLYRERALAEATDAEQLARIEIPTGIAIYPREIFRIPKAWAEHRFRLTHWYEAPRGGHFAALEQPQLFAADLWRFNETLRAS